MGLGEQQQVTRGGDERVEKGLELDKLEQEKKVEPEAEKRLDQSLEEVRVDTDRPSALSRVCIIGTGIFGRQAPMLLKLLS